jgi:hypothetical protein
MAPRLTTTPSTSSPPHQGPSHSRARQPTLARGTTLDGLRSRIILVRRRSVTHLFLRTNVQYVRTGNPDPQNTPPPTLVMPNFSVAPGGFGAGASATNATFYLAVFEEYATGEVSCRPNTSSGSTSTPILSLRASYPSSLLHLLFSHYSPPKTYTDLFLFLFWCRASQGTESALPPTASSTTQRRPPTD